MFLNVIKALKAGNELADPAKWKKGQVLTNAVGALLVAVIEIIRWKFPEISFPADFELYATELIATALVMVNLYLIPATTRKIGTK